MAQGTASIPRSCVSRLPCPFVIVCLNPFVFLQLLQQHINRSHRRLARMTGRAGPSSEELVSSIAKRMAAADEDIRRRSVLETRYNRNGLGGVSKGISAVINNAKAKLTGAKT